MGAISAAGCDPDVPAARPVVVLSIWDRPAESPRPPIQGTLACDDPAEIDPLCVQDDSRLAAAVLGCGSPEATIDRASSHVGYVHFPAGLHERFEAVPADLDIVRCVRGRVGFRFAAGIARDRSTLEGADQRPFASLRAPAR